MREIGHFVGGKEMKGVSGRFGDVFNPNTGDVQAKVDLASKALATAFGLTVTREMQERDVLILRAPNGLGSLRPSAGGREMPIRSDEGQVTSKGTNLKYFANVMEAALNRPILDETGAGGLFDLALYWDAKNPDSAIQAIREQLGLELVPQRRTIEVMVVTSSER